MKDAGPRGQMSDWQLQFSAAVVASAFLGLVLYGLLGPLAAILWSGAAFAFGAMWAISQKEDK